MNAANSIRLSIILGFVVFMVWVGISLGKWTQKESAANDARIQQAMSVLHQK
jgi:hypothetical protein